MKKYLVLAASGLVLSAAVQTNALFDGTYVGVNVGGGYRDNVQLTSTKAGVDSYNTIPLAAGGVGAAAGTATVATLNTTSAVQKRSGGAFLGSLTVGTAQHINPCTLYDLFAGLSYDTSSVIAIKQTGLDAVTGTTDYTRKYRPGVGFNFGGRIGRMLGDTVAGYLGLSVDYNMGKLTSQNTATTGAFNVAQLDLINNRSQSSSVQVWSLSPHVAFRGEVNETVNWLAVVGYKMAVSITAKTPYWAFDKKPTQLYATVGVTYKI